MITPIRRFGGVAVLLFAAGVAHAQSYTHQILIDRDVDAATGCSIATPEGTLVGIDARLTATITTYPANVQSLTLARCEGAALGSEAVLAPGYAVGYDVGVGGSDVIEFAVDLAQLPGSAHGSGDLRLWALSNSESGAADLLGPAVAAAIVGPGGAGAPAVIPTLGPWSLLLLSISLGLAFAWAVRRHRGLLPVLLVASALSLAGIAWAANYLLDGQVGDWTGAPLASDPADDTSTPDAGSDIRALWVAREGDRLFFRIDVAQAQIEQLIVQLVDVDLAVDEDALDNAVVGELRAFATGLAGLLRFQLLGQTPPGAFAVDTNGRVTVMDETRINAAANPTHSLDVQASINDVPLLTAQLDVTVTIGAVNAPPSFVAQSFTVAGNAPVGTVVATLVASDDDGDPLNFTLLGGNTGGAFALSSAGVLTVADAGAVQAASTPFVLQVRASDGVAQVDATITVTVDPGNRAPGTATPMFTTDEDVALSQDAPGLLTGISDPDGDPLTVAAIPATAPAHGTLTLAADGAFVYTPAADFNGIDGFVYAVEDGRGGRSESTATIVVSAQPDAPVATADAFDVAEGGTLAPPAPGVLGNDSDADGDPLVAVLVSGPTHAGAFALNPDGSFSYVHDGGTATSDSFVYRASDGSLTSDPVTVTITIMPVDDAPVAADDAYSVDEGDTLAMPAPGVLGNDSDNDGDPLTAVLVSGPAHASAFVLDADGSFSYTHDGGETTTDSFTYRAHDGAQGSLPATVVITINPVNDAPVAVADSYTVAERGTLAPAAPGVLGNDSDADGDPLTAVLDSGPTHASAFVLNPDGSFSYVHDGGAGRSDSFSYRATDGTLDSATTTVTITIDEVNDPPVAVDDAYTVAEGDTLAPAAPGVLGNDSDPEGDTLIATLVTAPTQASAFVLNADGSFSYTHDGREGGAADSFSYVAGDGSSSSATATVTLTITPVDDPPVAVDDAATVVEDAGATPIDVLANDSDAEGDALLISAVTQPANGVVAITGGGSGLSYAPNADYCNSDSGVADAFTYTLAGGGTATVAVSVTCVDDPPVAVDDSATVAEDDGPTAIAVAVNDTDVDGGAYAITSVTQPANGSVAITGGGSGLTYAPNAGYCNTPPGTTLDTFTYTLAPGGSTASVSVTVNCYDEAPVAVDDLLGINEDIAVTGFDVLANDTDADGGPISIASVTQPDNGAVAITDGGTRLSYTPDADYCNQPPGTTPDLFTYTLAPGGSIGTVRVNVTCVDDPPVAVADNATVAEDAGASAIDVLANDTDVDGGPISIASVTTPANGTVAITGGGSGLSYTPDPDYCNTPPGTAPDTFTYVLAPGTASATVSVAVTCVDDDPVAVDDAATVAEDATATTIDVLANDTDAENDAFTIASVTQPANGTVVIGGGGGALTYAPNANYCNTPPGTTPDTFTYTLAPGGASATVSVAVTCIDDAPVAVADSPTVIEDSGANAIDVLANDSDIDGGPIAVTAVTQPANGVVVITGGGSGLSYAPAANYCNTDGGSADTFTYTLAPGGSSTTVSVTVTCVNDAPVAGSDSYTTFGNTELRVEMAAASTPHVLVDQGGAAGLLANDSDPVEGSTVSIGGIVGCVDTTAPFECSTTGGGTITVASDGSFSYLPPQADPAVTASSVSDSVQYTLIDAEGGTATGTVNFALNEVIWYVDPGAPGGGDGRSHAPFNSLAALNGVGGVGDLDNGDDYILIRSGTINGSIELEAGQRLLGAGVGLSLPLGALGTFELLPVGSAPLLQAASGAAIRIGNGIPARIAGLKLAATLDNAIDLTTTGAMTGATALTIERSDIVQAGAEGIDVNLNAGTSGTLTLTLADLGWDATKSHTGNAIDISRSAGNLQLDLSRNTGILSTGGNGVAIGSNTLGAIVIRGFADNTVHRSTAGIGITMSNVRFDADASTAGDQPVDGGTLAVGDATDAVGSTAMRLDLVQGALEFDDLDLFGGTGGLYVNGSGAFALGVIAAPPASTGSSVIRAGNGPALDISNADIDLRLADLDATSTGSALTLNAVGGRLSVNADGSLGKTAGAGTAVSIANSRTGAVFDLAAPLNVSSGAAIALANNTGASITFSGGMTLSTGASTAISATGGGTLVITDPAGVANNTITTTSGTALNVVNTTIGAGGLTFERISTGTSGTPTGGIVLDNTGTQGGLTVTGTGTAASGGTIRNASGDGIALTSTRDVSLSWMNIEGNKGNGISGSSVRGLSFSNLRVLNNTDALTEGGIKLLNLSGSNTITNVEVAGSTEDNLRVTNTSGTLDSLTISGTDCLIRDNSQTFGNVGINIQASGTAVMNGVVIDGCELYGNRTVAIRGDAADTSSLAMTVRNNTITAGTGNTGNQGIEIGAASNAVVTSFDIDNNKVGTDGTTPSPLLNTGINVSAGGTGSCHMTGRVRNNKVHNAGAGASGFGIRVFQSLDCVIDTSLANNTIANVGLDYGLLVDAAGGAGNAGGISAEVVGNTVAVLPDALDALRVQARQATTMCARVTGNTTNHPNDAGCTIGSAFCGLFARQANTSTFRIEGCAVGPLSAAQASTCLAGQNSEDSINTAAATGFQGVATNFCGSIP